jgi:trk system potassium uptake protein TrkA
MRVIVVGCGRVGSQLATLLSVEGHDVVVIDKEPESFRRLGTAFNGMTIVGIGFDEDVLASAGTRGADAFAAVTDFDNSNLMAAEVARKLFGVKHVVARLYNPDRERTYQRLGLDHVCGTTIVAQVLLEKIMAGHGHHLTHMGDIEIIEFMAGEKAEGKRVRDLEADRRFRIAAIMREDVTFIPEPDTVIHMHDIITGAVKEDAFHKVERFMEE